MANKDYYDTLGVSKSSSADDIKKAFKRLSRQYHPDLNPDDPAAEEKFKEIAEAYHVLSDPQKRRQYDLLGHDFHVDAPPGGWQDVSSWFDPRDFDDIFGDIFSGLFTQRRRGRPRGRKGMDLEVTIEVPFDTAVNGGTFPVRVDLPRQCESCEGSGRVQDRPCVVCHGNGLVEREETINVKIPPGLADGARISIPARGAPGRGGGPDGDLHLVARLQEHPLFKRDGDDLHLEVPITFVEATLGAEITVPTPSGRVTLKIPAGCQSGQRLRLRNKGIQRRNGKSGHLYATLKIVVPKDVDEDTAAALREIGEALDLDPRQELEEAL